MCFRSATLSNPGSLKTVASTHFSGESRSGSSRWKTRDPDHAAILADIDSELDPAVRYSSGRPRGREEHGGVSGSARGSLCSLEVRRGICDGLRPGPGAGRSTKRRLPNFTGRSVRLPATTGYAPYPTLANSSGKSARGRTAVPICPTYVARASKAVIASQKRRPPTCLLNSRLPLAARRLERYRPPSGSCGSSEARITAWT